MAYLSQANYFAETVEDEEDVTADVAQSKILLEKATEKLDKVLSLNPIYTTAMATVGVFYTCDKTIQKHCS